MRNASAKRQKPAQQHYATDETNAETSRQYFQVTVNVLEAQKLSWANPHSANSYVIAVIGKKIQRTGVIKNMMEPFYREYFVFELYNSIREVQEQSIWLAVMEPRCCASPRMIGEATVDLEAIWKQPHHQVFHKWIQLSISRDSAAGVVGFLKVDISIIFRGDIHMMPVTPDNNVENNLLQPSGSEQQRANYVITVHAALGIPRTSIDKRGKLPSTFVKVTFCGLTAKTAVQPHTSNPFYSEQISIVEMFPNMNQIIKFELCSGDSCINKSLGSTQLSLEQISHDGENGFLPTFGPSLLHVYGSLKGVEHGGCYRGSLLVSLKTEVPYYHQAIRTTSVEPVAPLKIDSLWTWEDFCIFCPIFEVSMLDRHIVGKLCGVAITIGEIPGDDVKDEEFHSMIQEIRSRKLHYTGSIDVLKSRPVYGYLDFTNSYPVLQQAMRFPDFRFRMYRNNMVHDIVSCLEVIFEEIERRLKNSDYSTPSDLIDLLNKAMDDAASKMGKYLELIQYSSPAGSNDDLARPCTDLDQKQIALQKEEIEKIYRLISDNCKSTKNKHDPIKTLTCKRICYPSSRKTVKVLLSRAKSLAQDLKNYIFMASDGSPAVVVWLLNSGSRVAYIKIPLSDIIYSNLPEQCGKLCGRIQTIYLKPLKCSKHGNANNSDCFCIAGKIELLLWMGLYKQITAFETYVPIGYKIKVKDNEMCLKASTLMLECRLCVYRAKLTSFLENSNITHIFVRFNAMNAVKETQIKQNSSAPVWNQVLRIYNMMFTSEERLASSPIIATVEVYGSDLVGNVDLIGRCDVQPVIDYRQNYEHEPKSQWHDIFIGVDCTGQLLVSAQLLQVPETLMKSTNYSPVQETYYITGAKEIINQDADHLELLPDNLVPKSSTYKIDVYWWGLRQVSVTKKPSVVLEIDELTIKSDIIINKKPNVNFAKGRSSHKFETIISDSYHPTLTIKLCDNSTFGRTIFLGTNVVKNPYKYLVKWLPENLRDSSLKSVSIASSNFYPSKILVTPMLYFKTNKTSNSQSLNKIQKNNVKNVSMWKRLFSSKEPDEEECALLPIFSKQEEIKQVNVARNEEEKDWWMRYYCSQKNYNDLDCTNISDTIVIYNSELEAQPEFSKFKDWCSTLKLYNGKKTGIPEKDEHLRCCYLKAGIVIYEWPPTSKTTAVSPQGVDLDKGEYPSNDTTRHLVRVYVVQGLHLIAKDFTGKSDPYVVISCGTKHLGDRNNYVSNSINPVFGIMYELRCTLPEDYLLTISLYDHDTLAPDELIGSSSIDLEDRIYSKHRAYVGLSKKYNVNGTAKWRDCMKPSSILEELCLRNHISLPVYPDDKTVVFNGVEYKDSERAMNYSSPSQRRQNICLNLLHKWHTMPVCGYHLVPEHVETRTLFNPERPGFEQGKIQLWIDIYSLNGTYIPLPVDITPRKAEDFELRVVVWNVRGLKVKNSYGRGLADIYVKAWIGIARQAQYTDVNYQSRFGVAAFNWRMIFNFQYHYNGIKLSRTETAAFPEYEERVPPILIVQVLENDAVSKEDFIGTLALDLNSIPRGSDISNRGASSFTEFTDKINLFASRFVRSWWPLTFTDLDTGMKITAGMVELELTLLPAEKAILMPVGIGRDPPAPLPEPWRCNKSYCAERSMLTIESIFRHGSLEYLIVGAIIIISLVSVFWYFEMPTQLYTLFFDKGLVRPN